MDTFTNQQTINNAHNIPFMTHVFLGTKLLVITQSKYFKNVLVSCLLYFLILYAELYALMLQNNYTLSYFHKCVHIISYTYFIVVS
jgi:hypothetical protein